MIPQIDGVIDDRWMRYIGAAKTFVGRSRFYFNVPQFLMIAVMFYFSSPVVREFSVAGMQPWPTIWHWVGFLLLCGVGTVIFEYSVMLPSQISFNQDQVARENRSPVYREVKENGRRLDRLEGQLTRADGGATVVVPECQTCEAAGQPDEHKDEDVIACPDCGDILHREVRR